jgi:hypothetical protein
MRLKGNDYMSDISYDQLYQTLIASVPELRRDVESEFGVDYDLEHEIPGAYPIFEDVVQEFLWDKLDGSGNSEVLRRLFALFEKLATSRDLRVKDLLRIAILEPLVYCSDSLERARPYMGSMTAEFVSREEQRQQALRASKQNSS